MTQTLADWPLAGHASPARSRQFLQDLANVGDYPESWESFVGAHPLVFPEPTALKRRQAELSQQQVAPEMSPGEDLDSLIHRGFRLPLRNCLRSIWLTPDRRLKEWLIFGLRDLVMSAVHDLPVFSNALFLSGPVVDWGELPAPSPFERALGLLLTHADKTRYCAREGCETPYFLALRRTQKYCSNRCAREAQRQLMRQWWSDHGPEWRKSRRRQTARASAFRNRGKRKGR
jgi:hypothetical protein